MRTSGRLARRAALNAFAQRASYYAREARLQQAVAWRLARHCRDLNLLPGPVLDLGAGSGNLSKAMAMQRPEIEPLLVDNCAELLAEAAVPANRCRHWDLNAGLPPEARAAALLLSSFALHWLKDPQQQLRHWCEQLQPGGWLALAVPLQGSLASWHQAAERAGVACSALPLPQEEELLAALPPSCQLHQHQRLRFSCRYRTPMAFLSELKRHGVSGGASAQLRPSELRLLQQHWPMQEQDQGVNLNWDLLLLLSRRDQP